MSFGEDSAEEGKETHSVGRGKREVTEEKRKEKAEMREEEEEEHIRKLFERVQKSLFWGGAGRKEEKLSEFRDFGKVSGRGR